MSLGLFFAVQQGISASPISVQCCLLLGKIRGAAPPQPVPSHLLHTGAAQLLSWISDSRLQYLLPRFHFLPARTEVVIQKNAGHSFETWAVHRGSCLQTIVPAAQCWLICCCGPWLPICLQMLYKLTEKNKKTKNTKATLFQNELLSCVCWVYLFYQGCFCPVAGSAVQGQQSGSQQQDGEPG